MFPERMILLMKEKKITKKRMSEDLKFGINQIKYWEENHNVPSAALLLDIANYLGTTVEYLLEEDDKMNFYQTVRELCQKKGTTPTALCKELHLSTAMPTQWKRGTIPNGSTLKKIADYFNVTVSELLGEEQKKPSYTVEPINESAQFLKTLELAMKDMTKDELKQLIDYFEFLMSKKKKD